MDLKRKAEIIGEIRLIRTELEMNQTQFGRLIYPELNDGTKSAGNKLGKIESGRTKDESVYYIALERARQAKERIAAQTRPDALEMEFEPEAVNGKAKDIITELEALGSVCQRLDRLTKAIEGITNAIYVTDKRRRNKEQGAENEE